MKTQMKTFAMMVGLLAMSAMMALAQGGRGGSGGTRDPLAGLKRAITQAEAPALTATQETAINALITAYRDALPDEADAALETARDAYEAALLAGNQTAANTAADQIAARQAVLSAARLKASAKLTLDILANLRTGGQLTALNTKFTAERVLSLVRSLAGGGGFGGRD
ncbi:MAG: hypothetical protein HOP19_26025 [Acidobacteria bacterium]|nr:hypothetical protein [Acidobacteriota bacterium]